MSTESDTIAAIATAPGAASIAIVRVSGPTALAVADRMFVCAGAPPSQRSSHTVIHGRVSGAAGETLDEALLLIMRSPRSYTGEDVVEFQCHGGAVSAARVLRRAIEVGCRVAEPGEFTKRAFLNGRIDLTQAEGVLALIQAGSERAADAALRLLQGHLGREINRLYDLVVTASANLDASLDFPEEDIPSGVLDAAHSAALEARKSCSHLLSTWSCGKLLRHGFRVVILGRANAGKSTLFNMLSGSDRAIVSQYPGTTRDTIESWTQIHGVQVCLVDTAGFADTECPIESEGIRRSRAEAYLADMIIYCCPANEMCDQMDSKIIASLPPKPTIIALTKTDIARPDRSVVRGITTPCVETTIKDPSGSVCRINAHISNYLEGIQCASESSPVIISERHRSALEAARVSLEEAISLMESARGDACVLASESLKSAADELAKVIGRSYDADLLNAIFGAFCIGK